MNPSEAIKEASYNNLECFCRVWRFHVVMMIAFFVLMAGIFSYILCLTIPYHIVTHSKMLYSIPFCFVILHYIILCYHMNHIILHYIVLSCYTTLYCVLVFQEAPGLR